MFSPPFLGGELKNSNFINDGNLDTSSLTKLQICLVRWIKLHCMAIFIENTKNKMYSLYKRLSDDSCDGSHSSYLYEKIVNNNNH